jgi:hypothetical protein
MAEEELFDLGQESIFFGLIKILFAAERQSRVVPVARVFRRKKRPMHHPERL